MASMSATEQVQQQNELDNAELSLQEASVRLQTLSYQDDDDVASFDLAGRSSDDVRIESNGNLTFQLNGEGACTARMELGSIVYRNDEGQSVAYQAGGVWRDDGDGVSLVSPPGLTYQTEQVDNRTVRSVDFPVVNVQGDLNSASGEVTARQVDNPGGPNMEQQLCLPVSENSTIDRVRSMTITVSNNTYYEAWERYLDDEFGDEIPLREPHKEVDDANQTLRYTVPLGQDLSPDEFTIDDAPILGGFYSGSAAGEINLKQNGLLDSYDGSQGTYASQPENWGEGNIYTNSRVAIKNSDVNGSIYSGSGVELKESYLVNGDVYFNNSTGSDLSASGGGTITGETDNGTHIPPLPAVDDRIEAALNTTADANHNNRTDVIQNNVTTLSTGETATLESPGVFYLDSLNVPQDATLVLDTSSGDVVLAVEEKVEVAPGAEIRVQGDGQARMFVGGESGNQLSLDSSRVGVHNGSQYTNRSDGLWFYCKSGCSGEFLDGSRFTGVVYGPGDAGGVFGIGKESEVFGALAVDRIDTTAGNNGEGNTRAELHFDTSVQTAEFDRNGDGTPDSEEGSSGGVPEKYDECPDIEAMGVNGCQPVNEDETANALIVNQSHAKLTVVGSMVADNRTQTREVGEREPLDVVFVIDDSGSMGNPEVNEITDGAIELDGGWTAWETPEEASYVDPDDHEYGWAWVPEDTVWEVRYLEPGAMGQETEYLTEDERADLEKDNSGDNDGVAEIRRVDDSGGDVTIPDGQIWLVSNNPYADEGDAGTGSTQWVYEGQTIDTANWNYVRMYGLGNDPTDERADAMRTFIGMLNASNGDRVGAIEFTTNGWYDTETVWQIENGNDFDGANSSLSLNSEGGTPMEEAIRGGAAELQDGDNDNKVMILLTDGRPDGTPGGVIGAADDVNDNIQIQTVGLGGNTNTSLLQDIADETGGNYSQVGDSEQLNETFRQIAGQVTEQQYNVIEYKDTTVEISIDDETVTLSGNANDPTATSRPSRTINIADTLGFDEEQVDQYVGTLLSAEATTYACDNVSETGDTQSHDGTTYDEVTCESREAGTFDQINNSSKSDHEIYVDGESIPDASEFDTGWFKDESFRQVINDYDSSLIADTDGDSTADEFSLGENDAVIVVRTNSSNSDTDYVVLHFEAWNEGPWVVNGSDDGSSQVVGDDSSIPDPTDDNSYVIDIDQSNVELGNESASIVALPGDVVDRAVTGDAGGTPTARLVPSQSGASAARARSAV
ncbi:VWA domain-containing protein [Haloarchaeobius iranensis]|nr:vWA domain-containing protein [Haloarchaeobius iranensis]